MVCARLLCRRKKLIPIVRVKPAAAGAGGQAKLTTGSGTEGATQEPAAKKQRTESREGQQQQQQQQQAAGREAGGSGSDSGGALGGLVGAYGSGSDSEEG